MSQPKGVLRRVQIADGVWIEIDKGKVEIITCPSAPLETQRPGGPSYGVNISVSIQRGAGASHAVRDALMLIVRQDIADAIRPGPLEFK